MMTSLQLTHASDVNLHIFPFLSPMKVEDQVQGAAEVAKAALSNLVGGMGFFHGQSRIAVPKHLQVGCHSCLGAPSCWGPARPSEA